MSEDGYPLATALLASLPAWPDDAGLRWRGAWMPRRRIRDLAMSVDAQLSAAGVEKDHAVGLVLRNRPAGFAALVSLVASGRTVSLISPFQSAEKVATDVGALRLAGIVASADDWSSEALAAATASGSAGVSLSDEDMTATMAPSLAQRDHAAAHTKMPGVAVQMLTSGTTGAPKRIPLTRRGLSMAIVDMVNMGRAMGEAPREEGLAATLLGYAPMVQIAGLYTALQAAFESKPLALTEKFSVDTWLESLRETRAHMAGLPPAMMRMVLEADPPREALSSLRAVRSGGAPLDAQTRDTFEERYGAPVLSMYGATEFVGPVACWSIEDYAVFGTIKRGSVGRFCPGVAEGRIVDPDSGALLAAGESGLLEVLVGRSGLEWIRTNDLAVLDEDGFLFIQGRADDAINRGGFKIPPDVISDALRTHPAVYDAAAIPFPDPRLGQVPVAAVELKREAEAAASEEDLLAYTRSKLIAYQVPTRILVVPSLPRTPAQKISRPGVYELFEQSAGGAPSSDEA